MWFPDDGGSDLFRNYWKKKEGEEKKKRKKEKKEKKEENCLFFPKHFNDCLTGE